MTGEIFTKAAYARRIGVRPSAVSNYIARRKLTPPAVRADGTLDATLADQQLDIRLETLRRAGQVSNAKHVSLLPTPASPADVLDLSVSRQLLQAKATAETIRAERLRRELESERGRFMLAGQAEAAWRATLAAFLLDVETALPDLNYQLDGLDSRARLIVISKWWRTQRVRGAEHNRLAAAEAPEFIEPDTAHGL